MLNLINDDLYDETEEAITSFSGEYAFLSNFYQHPNFKYVDDNGYEYHTLEAIYVANKSTALSFRKKVSKISSYPGKCKRFGSPKNKELVLRENWDSIKIPVMESLVDYKFDHPDLRRMLLATGMRLLVEGNHHGDRFWGQCPVGNGENHLGIILMEKRRNLRNV